MGSRESVAVVGGGIAGVSAALELARSGRARVVLFERADGLGGLCASYRWDAVTCDRYYHVVLPTDAATIAFLEGLGLGPKLRWAETGSGFFKDGRIAPFSSAWDFAKFPFLSPWRKLRLGVGILRASRITAPDELDRLPAFAWLDRMFGAGVTEAFWDPLLRSKLGDARRAAPASFIQATIRRLGGARRGANKKERMGYVEGGFAAVFEAAREKLVRSGAEIRLGTPVLGTRDRAGRVELETPAGTSEFDRVLFAVPDPEIPRPGERQGAGEAGNGYLGIVCALLILKRALTPYYVLNLLDTSLPFTGVIESTNIIPADTFGGAHLIYLPKYVTPDDPLRTARDESVLLDFVSGLRRIVPDLSDGDILHARIFRNDAVFALPRTTAGRGPASIRTSQPGVYRANPALLRDETLNNNAILKIAGDAARLILADARG